MVERLSTIRWYGLSSEMAGKIIITWDATRSPGLRGESSPYFKMADEGISLPSGYEYDFVSTVLDEYHCIICHLPLREPVLTRCGHRYCKKCLYETIRRNR